jgi:transcription factor C subunit 7
MADCQLTGNKFLEVLAGCASTSLYKRKTDAPSAGGPTANAGFASNIPCGVGEWDVIYTGRADYLENGLERDWSLRDAVIVDGEVITVSGSSMSLGCS